MVFVEVCVKFVRMGERVVNPQVWVFLVQFEDVLCDASMGSKLVPPGLWTALIISTSALQSFSDAYVSPPRFYPVRNIRFRSIKEHGDYVNLTRENSSPGLEPTKLMMISGWRPPNHQWKPPCFVVGFLQGHLTVN
jgi:hypothetical protein